MITMKKIVLTLLVAAFGVVAVQAQDIPGRKNDFKPHEKHRGHDRKGLAELNLSEDQKAKFQALNKEHREKMETLKKQDNITVKESREKMESLRKEHHEKMQSILTTDQKTQMQKQRDEQKARFKERGENRGQRMKTELNLTADQSAKLDASRKAMSEKMRSIREDKALTDEQKKEKSKELMKQQKESLKSILTEEQLQKMKDGRKKGPGMKSRK
jgi:Spy/CpxP family protein refolding chaperone